MLVAINLGHLLIIHNYKRVVNRLLFRENRMDWISLGLNDCMIHTKCKIATSYWKLLSNFNQALVHVHHFHSRWVIAAVIIPANESFLPVHANNNCQRAVFQIHHASFWTIATHLALTRVWRWFCNTPVPCVDIVNTTRVTSFYRNHV